MSAPDPDVVADQATPQWGIPGVVTVLIAWFMGGLFSSLIAFGLFGANAADNPWTLSIVFLGQSATGLGGLIVLSRLRGRRSLIRDFGCYGFPIDLIWIVAGVGLQLLGLILVGLLLRITGGEGSEQGAVQVLRDAGVAPKIALAICVGVLAPIIEELLFRGALQRALQRHIVVPLAVLIQALAFSSIHLFDLGAVTGLPSIFAVGLLAGFLAARTSRLGPAIALHAGFNLTVVFLLFFFA